MSPTCPTRSVPPLLGWAAGFAAAAVVAAGVAAAAGAAWRRPRPPGGRQCGRLRRLGGLRGLGCCRCGPVWGLLGAGCQEEVRRLRRASVGPPADSAAMASRPAGTSLVAPYRCHIHVIASMSGRRGRADAASDETGRNPCLPGSKADPLRWEGTMLPDAADTGAAAMREPTVESQYRVTPVTGPRPGRVLSWRRRAAGQGGRVEDDGGRSHARIAQLEAENAALRERSRSARDRASPRRWSSRRRPPKSCGSSPPRRPTARPSWTRSSRAPARLADAHGSRRSSARGRRAACIVAAVARRARACRVRSASPSRPPDTVTVGGRSSSGARSTSPMRPPAEWFPTASPAAPVLAAITVARRAAAPRGGAIGAHRVPRGPRPFSAARSRCWRRSPTRPSSPSRTPGCSRSWSSATPS